MKNYIARIISVAAIMIVGCAIHVSGQTGNKVTADIPFDFFAGKEKLPAGTYEFEVANRHAHPGALVIRSTRRGAYRSIIIPTLVDKPAIGISPSILFNRYGSTYFFSKIQGDAGSIPLKVWKSRDEKRMAKESQEVIPVRIQPTVLGGR
jgi:hypothetical protein